MMMSVEGMQVLQCGSVADENRRLKLLLNYVIISLFRRWGKGGEGFKDRYTNKLRSYTRKISCIPLGREVNLYPDKNDKP